MNTASKAEPKVNTLPMNWITIDFHIHTPESQDFQDNGDEIIQKYLEILREAVDKCINVLVITDHNSIEGYYKFLEISDDLLRAQKVLVDNNIAVDDKIKSSISFFEDVTILPGIELDVYPNIHLLILIDPCIEKSVVDETLSKSGFKPEDRGSDVAGKSTLTVEEALNEWGKLGCIIIASHVDSNKGLYQETQTWGEKRVSAFTNEYLYGMEFNNPKNRDKIKSLFLDPRYLRSTQLAFVQSSDYHGGEDHLLGSKKTYLKIPGFGSFDKTQLFQGIKKALRNPDECVSAPESPEVAVILNNLKSLPCIESLSDEGERSRLIQYLVAYANSEDGTFVVGKNERGNWVGYKSPSEDEVKEQLESIINSSIIPKLNYETGIYDYGEKKFVLSIRVKKSLRLFSTKENDIVYVMQKSLPQKASSQMITELAESNLIRKYRSLSISNRLSEISTKLSGLTDTIDVLPIIRKFDKKSTILAKLKPQFAIGDIASDEVMKVEAGLLNGYVEGNLIFLQPQPPRLRESYLRLTAPKIEVGDQILNDLSLYTGEKIIICAGGSVFFDNGKDIHVTCARYKPLIITGLENCLESEMKILAVFMKTSIALWYEDRYFESFDVRNQRMLMRLPIPTIDDSNIREKIIGKVDELIERENRFLQEERELVKDCDKEKDLPIEVEEIRSRIIDKHNENANRIVGEIENIFYEFLELDDDEIEIIETVVKSLGLPSFR